MTRRYDIAHVAILIVFLVVAGFIGNAIMKGILLLLFSGVLIFNIILKLKTKSDEQFTDKIFYGILLFLDSVLALSSIYVIVTAAIEAL